MTTMKMRSFFIKVESCNYSLPVAGNDTAGVRAEKLPLSLLPSGHQGPAPQVHYRVACPKFGHPDLCLEF